MDPGQLNLPQQYENNSWSKMIFEQKLVWANNVKNGGFRNFGGSKM